MRLALQEYAPDSWKAIQHSLGDVLSDNERKALEIIREVFPEDDLEMTTTGQIKFKDCVETLKTP